MFFLSLECAGQLQDVNFNYLYDVQQPFRFSIRLSRAGNDSLRVVYHLHRRDTSQPATDFSIAWSFFKSMNDREGSAFNPSIHSISPVAGTFKVAKSEQLLAARVALRAETGRYFFVSLSSAVLPTFLTVSGQPLDQGFVHVNDAVTIHSAAPSLVFFYNDDFPAAAPPFSETQSTVSNRIEPDSTLTVRGDFRAFGQGLFLFQQDTTTSSGIAFRAEQDYPKLGRLESLVGPISYITTKSESDRLSAALGDKAAFDKVILGITGSAERARLFMRNYFRRVEQANTLFTSYKEGWKTDRGMIFIVFGIPERVFKFADREVWEYKTLDDKTISFTFVRSSSVFDPDNFVLIRKRSLQEAWLEAVDLNRNARF